MATDGKKPAADVEYLHGIHLAYSILWLDSPRLAELCFISHALLKPYGPHRKLILSERTWYLLGQNAGAARALAVPFYRRFSVGELDLELAPSGYLPGAAQLVVRRERRRLVYSGDFCLLERRTTERAQPLPAEQLVLKAELGLEHHRFPPAAESEGQALLWTKKTLEAGRNAVWLLEDAGAALELAALALGAGLPVQLHKSLFWLARRAAAMGVPVEGARRFRSQGSANRVIVWPLRLRNSPALRHLPQAARAAAGAMACRPDSAARLGVELAVCLSNLPDRTQMETYLKGSEPRRVWVSGRCSRPVAEWLRRSGWRAEVLQPPEQMSLFRAGGRSTDGSLTDVESLAR